jgi:undecaprenyl-diphosphatase
VPPQALYAVAVPMALSRLYLGVHYPSDIVVGAALGTVTASVL